MHVTSAGNLIIVAAPSGGGKTSLIRQLIARVDNVSISISYTTRLMRPGEKHGVDYFFVSEPQFLQMIKEKAFIEHAKVFDYYYGTSIEQIKTKLQAGIDVVLAIDWQGAQQIRTAFPNTISIFIIPPSLDVLQQRLLNRKQDNTDVITARMQRAQNELSHYAEFDYLIINDDFTQAVTELSSIVLANRLKTSRQIQQHKKLLFFLLSSE